MITDGTLSAVKESPEAVRNQNGQR